MDMRDEHAQLRRRTFLKTALAGASTLALSGCIGSSLGTLPADQIQPGAQPQVTGEVIGTGSVRVGLLLPMSSSGGGTSIGNVFKNSASSRYKTFQMPMFSFW